MWPVCDISVNRSVPWPHIYTRMLLNNRKCHRTWQSTHQMNKAVVQAFIFLNSLACGNSSVVTVRQLFRLRARRQKGALIKTSSHIFNLQPPVLLRSFIFDFVHHCWQLLIDVVTVMRACSVGGEPHEFWSDTITLQIWPGLGPHQITKPKWSDCALHTVVNFHMWAKKRRK